MDVSIKALHKNIMEWMAGPVGTILLHALVIFAALFLVDMTIKEKEPEIEVQIVELDTQQLDELLEDLKPPEDLPELVDTITPPDVNIDMMPPPDIQDFAAAPVMDSVAELNIASDAFSPIIMKNLAPGNMVNRSGDGRSAAIAGYGGQWGELAEAAVLRALEWLRLNQNPDGSWGKNDREAMAGLGILTFLAHGETTTSEKYGPTVERAIRYLVARQNDKGHFDNVETTSGTYSQAICVYALSEAYGMTRIPSLKSVMQKGVQVLIDGQQPKGGYDYKFAKGSRRDTSLGGWCAQAMKAAYIAGAENQKLKEAMDKAVEDMKSAQREDNGSFYYTDRGSHSTHSMCAVALLSLQLLGYGTDPAARRGQGFLDSATCNWKSPPEWPMYAWYYISQAKFHQGGGTWKSWNNQFAPQFIRNQNKDGSWDSPGVAAFEKGRTGRENYHPVYATTLAALTLQVYYRFLPTYQPIEIQVIDQKSSDDVKIEIL
ncbi:MAG: terpene cyclase/mutase family protein [Verrucomicrobiota bacterium]|jgi:hypothetical protein|nr:terpene cyclase/mutase family protein [Verrucomicrobiota bacterium]